VHSPSNKQVDQLFADEQWAAARALLEKELRKPGQKNDHWLLTRLSTTYYEEQNYPEALKWVEQAYKHAPNCPLVLWDLAGTLDALGRSADALAIYLKLLDRPIDAIAEDECGEGRAWAMGLLADCLYRAGLCAKHLGHGKLAISVFEAYLRALELGAVGIYSAEQAQAQIDELAGSSIPLLERLFKDAKHKLEECALAR
jgi:tetratricopeptide (TPR) repeat protein